MASQKHERWPAPNTTRVSNPDPYNPNGVAVNNPDAYQAGRRGNTHNPLFLFGQHIGLPPYTLPTASPRRENCRHHTARRAHAVRVTCRRDNPSSEPRAPAKWSTPRGREWKPEAKAFLPQAADDLRTDGAPARLLGALVSDRRSRPSASKACRRGAWSGAGPCSSQWLVRGMSSTLARFPRPTPQHKVLRRYCRPPEGAPRISPSTGQHPYPSPSCLCFFV